MGYQCEKCCDTGYMIVDRDGYEVGVKCECYERRVAMRRLKRSGISEELQKKGFLDFDCHGVDALVVAKEKAMEYYQRFSANENGRHNSIILCGQVGAGKTHLGMAICNNLLTVCNVGVVYMAYINAMTEIKQSLMDRENYNAVISPYYRARLLYIDDLLKGQPSRADLNILYEIVNYRYMNSKPMVISTEKSMEELVGIDEAIGSRVVEMCRGNIVRLEGDRLNYRLYSQGE